MRLLPLIGLVGLAGLAVASPVIGREASKDASVTPPKRLIVYTQLNYTGTPYEIHAEKDCVQFVAPVYKNMKSFKVADQVCYFMDEDACEGKALVIVDALGAEAWANTDDGTDFSTRITSVYCEDHSMRPPGSDTAVVKRDGSGETHDPIEKATDIVQTPFTATPCDDPRYIDPNFPTPPGFVYFCFGPGRSTDRGKNCNRTCTGANASNECFRMTWPWPSLVDTLWQAPGTVCKYYRYDCLDTWPSLIIDTRTISIPPQNFKGNGIFIGTVTCKSDWGTEELGAGPDTIVYNGTSTGPAQLKQETTGIVSRTEDKIIDVIICSRKDFAGDCTHLSSDTCWLLPPKIAHSAASWSQSEYLQCAFFAGPLCSDVLWWVNTGSKRFTANTSTRISDLTVAIRCDPIGATQSEAEANTGILSPTELLAPAAKRETDASLRVTGILCTGEGSTGGCVKVEGIAVCYLTASNAKPRSWRQSERLTCTFYSGGCEGDGIWTLSTDFIQKVVNLPLVVSHLVHAIYCAPVNDQSTLKADTIHLQPTKRGTDTALKVDGILCTGEDSTGQCINVDGGRCSIMAGNELFRTWRQSERLVCTIFSWAKKGCDGDGIWTLTTDFTYKVVNLPLVTSRQGHAISCVPSTGPEPGIASQVLVSDDDGFGGKTQLVDLVKDDHNCAPLSEDISWSLWSLIQYQGAVCNYWSHTTSDCGKSLPGHKPVFTVDSLGGQIGLSPIPEVFGGVDRYHIRSISCINGKAAADYMAALDPSEKVINIETPGVAKDTAFSTGPHNGQLAARSESTANDYFEPLALYHDPDQSGALMTYVGPGCGLNPFGVDPIKSLWQIQGFLCQFYPAWGCQETNGPPLWINSVDGPCYNRNVEFPILSISCTRSTHDDAIEGPEATQLIEYKAESTPAVLAPATLAPAALAIRPDAEDRWRPLSFCTGENMSGACFTYSGPGCLSGDPAVTEIKSLVVQKGFQCMFDPRLDCNKGFPHFVDAKEGDKRMDKVDWVINSVSCTPEPSSRSAVLAPGTITPALATRTDAANTFTPLRFCTGENLTGACFSYTGPDCASGDPAIFEMKSLVVDKDFQCVFMSGLNCNEGYPHYVDARQDENRINSIDWIVKSIYCKPEPWHG